MLIDEMPPTGGSTAMTARIRRLLLEPKLEWPRIALEPMSVKGIMVGWAVPLAAIGPVAGLIGSQVFGYGAFGFVYRPSLTLALTSAVVSYALSLLSVWVLSLIIDALAPTFQGVKDPVAAMKVAAFSATASWLAGIFQIIPMLGVLGIVGLYSLYLLYLGLPLLMKAPADKAIAYTVVSVLVAAVLFVVVGGITSSITARMAAPMFAGAPAGGTMSVAGVGSVDLGKLDAAAHSLDTANQQVAAGTKALVAPAVLASLLPASIAGWTRTTLESSGGGAAGIGASSASGHYTQGNDSMTLTVSDIGAMGALASIGQALDVQSTKQSEQGYERTGMVDGRMTTVKWDGAAHSGEYSTIVANRFTIAAEGHAPDDGQLKAAVGAIDAGKLAALAH